MKEIKIKFLLKLLAKTRQSLQNEGINITAYMGEKNDINFEKFDDFLETEIANLHLNEKVKECKKMETSRRLRQC